MRLLTLEVTQPACKHGYVLRSQNLWWIFLRCSHRAGYNLMLETCWDKINIEMY